MVNRRGHTNQASAEYIGTQVFSELILAGLSIQQVRYVATSPVLGGEVSRQIRLLCDRFDQSRDESATAA